MTNIAKKQRVQFSQFPPGPTFGEDLRLKVTDNKITRVPTPAFDASPRSFAFAGAPPGDPKGPTPAFDASPRSFAFAGAPPGDPKGPTRSDATFGGRDRSRRLA